MEFKPKICTPKVVGKTGLRHNPYASGGKAYISNYRKHNSYVLQSNCNVTPPKNTSFNTKGNHLQLSGTVKHKSFRKTQIVSSRSLNILKNSQLKLCTNENALENKWLAKPEKSQIPYVKSAKRSLSLGNSEYTDDPHGIFNSEDEDDDICLADRYNKPSVVDKENNNILKSSNSITSTFSTAKRKPLNTLHSSILHDISPKKVSLAYSPKTNSSKKENYFTFKKLGNKENDLVKPVDQEQVSLPVTEHPYLIGFLNYGNTCYLNAVLQTLVSLDPFILDIGYIINKINITSSSLTQSLWDVIVGRRKKDTAAVMKSLRKLKENVEKIDGSFSGFKMQDANEFLTQLLDTVKDEIDKSISLHITDDEATVVQLHSCDCNTKGSKLKETTNNHSSLFDTPSSDSLISLDLKHSNSTSSEEENEDIIIKRKANLNSIISLTPEKSVHSKFSVSPSDSQVTPVKFTECYINPVKENFEFELLESYRCLSCGEVESRKQKHFALYVNLPTQGNESIQQAIEAYMMEDQRELTCDKCSCKKASVITQFGNLPRILIVQLKRYEFKPEQLECIKVSSKVQVNLWLHLDSFTSQTGKPPPPWTERLFNINTPASTRQCKNKLTKTLSVRNLSSELNICDSTDKFASTNNPGNSTMSNFCTASEVETENQRQYEDKELEEEMVHNLEDLEEPDSLNQHNPDTEEEELQKAIKLSLLEMGMCFSQDQIDTRADEDLPDLKNVQLSGDEKIAENESAQQELHGKHSYRLLSVISHFGLTTCTGHYVSDIFNFDENQWLHYDDESVVRLQDSVVVAEGRQKNGYIFFYGHQDIYHKFKR